MEVLCFLACGGWFIACALCCVCFVWCRAYKILKVKYKEELRLKHQGASEYLRIRNQQHNFVDDTRLLRTRWDKFVYKCKMDVNWFSGECQYNAVTDRLTFYPNKR